MSLRNSRRGRRIFLKQAHSSSSTLLTPTTHHHPVDKRDLSTSLPDKIQFLEKSNRSFSGNMTLQMTPLETPCDSPLGSPRYGRNFSSSYIEPPPGPLSKQGSIASLMSIEEDEEIDNPIDEFVKKMKEAIGGDSHGPHHLDPPSVSPGKHLDLKTSMDNHNATKAPFLRANTGTTSLLHDSQRSEEDMLSLSGGMKEKPKQRQRSRRVVLPPLVSDKSVHMAAVGATTTTVEENNTTTTNNNNDNHHCHCAHKDTPPPSNPPQPRSLNPLLSFFRTNSATESLPNLSRSTTSMSLWSRLTSPSPSRSSLSIPNDDHLRKLKEEIKQDHDDLRKLKEEIQQEKDSLQKLKEEIKQTMVV